MKAKRTIVVGVALVSSVLALVLISFFLSQGSCSSGTFACWNSTFCVPHKAVCNKHKDCPDGEDEYWKTCSDFHGSLFVNSLLNNAKGWHPKVEICTLDSVPEVCECYNKTYVRCKNQGLTGIPEGISPSATRLVLSYNKIKNLPENAFSPYRFNLIRLDENHIETLPPGIFRNQSKLEKLLIANNSINFLDANLFQGLINLSIIFLQNNSLNDLSLEAFRQATNLQLLDLSLNEIELNGTNFPRMSHLKDLILEGNIIQVITNETFASLPELQYLDVSRNRITFIQEDAFLRLNDMRELDMSHNFLSTLHQDVFSNLIHLNKLFIGDNPIEYVPAHLFRNLFNLSSLSLKEIEITNIDVSMFDRMTKLQFIYFKKFYYCTFAPKIQTCKPKTDGISTNENLLGRPILRITVWIVAFFTCTGNVYVIWGRLTTRDDNRVLSWIVRNLAVSDFAMGVYLVVIGAKDIEYRGIYQNMSHEWISSWTCTTIGCLAMVSSEVSIFILVFMSFERFLLIAVPFGGHQNLTTKTSCYSLAVIWMFGLSVAVIPVIHWRNSTRFYGANGMCFPLHIDDPYFAGWEFSAFVFIGINLAGIIMIAFLYSGMFWSIWKTRNATTLNVGDFEFAIRFFFIVLTNTACWAPIIVLKLLAFFRIYISADAYSWVSVFVIPVNSAFNPLLYTLTTPKYREIIKYNLAKRMQPFSITRHQISTADTTYSHTSGNRNAVGFCTVSVQSGSSKGNSFDMPTFNTSLDRSSSAGFDETTNTSSRGNSFDLPVNALEHQDSNFHKDVRFQVI